MKRKLLILKLILISIMLNANSDYTIISGYVTDIDYGYPISMHEIFIETNDSVLLDIVFTDQSGYYVDSIYTAGIQIEALHIFTLDCNSDIHDTLVYDLSKPVQADFEICDPMHPYDCEANFIAFPEIEPFQVQFNDMSYGNPVSWSWDFGDGTFSEEQHPTHTFPQEGIYEVCLTIYDSLHNCTDTYCEDILVRPPGNCEAAFTIDQIIDQTVYFSDLSTGNITNWYWDFGDGSFSEEQNPVHTYPEMGKYFICLTVSNFDSIEYCFDVYCDTLLIIDTLAPCNAQFIASPDSTSTTPYLVYFNDLSTGNPDSWFWDSGYGLTSTEQNPEFIFPGPGQYTVCLTIIRSNPVDPCTDFICKEIVVPDYYDIGGFAFAGEYPINNPEATGDTGIAYLYRVTDSSFVIPVDTNVFTDYGYYWFTQKMEGDYVLRIQLSKTSSRYHEYFPTYYGNNLLWTSVINLPLHDSSFYNANINLQPTFSNSYSIGQINGNILWCPNYGIFTLGALENITVLLINDESVPVLFTTTNQDGSFSFTNLPFDNYTLVADVTGYFSTTETISINETNISAIAQLELCYSNVLDITDYDVDDDVIVRNIYPNPAYQDVYIDLEISETIDLEIGIYDIMGRLLKQDLINNASGTFTKNLSIEGLTEGVYLINITNRKGSFMETHKFIKSK